jgi:hypothetical protein
VIETANGGDFRVALLIPDGVAVRNFVLGNFLQELETASVDIYHSLPSAVADHYAKETPSNTVWHTMPPYRQTRAITTLQSCLAFAHMYWANTHSMRRALSRRVDGPFRTKLMKSFCRYAGRLAAGARRIEWLDQLHLSLVKKQAEVEWFKQQFAESRPDVVFSGCQRPAVVLPAIMAAKELGIPTATFVVSWDNLSSKGRIVAPYDHFLVWSDNMRKELLRYRPFMKPENIHVVGTPQFDPYGDRSLLWNRGDFFERIGGDPNRPLICFSGGDEYTCPEDPDHVRILMENIRSGKIRGNPQVAVRPSPVDDGKRYQPVRDQFPELLFLQPRWHHLRPGDWTQVIPSTEDIQFLANLVYYSDMNVNLGSTMTLDFGLHDKPVVNVAFDVANPPYFGMPVYDFYYHYEHFLPVVEFHASRIARAAEQFPDFVNAYLEDPLLDHDGRKRLVNLHVEVVPGESSKAVVRALKHMSAENVRAHAR